jgi:hypothetical protein
MLMLVVLRKRRTNVTLKSVVLPLIQRSSEQFRAYLSAGWCSFRSGPRFPPHVLTDTTNTADEWSSDDSDDDGDSDNDDKNLETAPPCNFISTT